MKNLYNILGIVILLALFSCQGANKTEEPAGPENGSESIQSGEIVLSRKQFDASAMKVGAPDTVMFSKEIQAKGNLSSTLSGRAKINTLLAGRVAQVNYTVGDRVKAGGVLFRLESNQIIQLQQEYAEVANQMKALKADYERQKSLLDEKIIAEKEFIKTEGQYRSMQAKAEGLKARLKMIHMNPAQIESGSILPELTVRSPISGVVSRQELVLGQFIDPGQTVMEVIDPGKLQLNLKVFERDLEGLAVGQNVKFHIPGREDRIYEATLSHIGSSIDPETKTIQCIASLQQPEQGAFVNNLYLESRIITCQREARVIPESALSREPDRDFVWILQGEKDGLMTFRKMPVQTGVTQGGYTEILEEKLDHILLEGAYNLWSGE